MDVEYELVELKANGTYERWKEQRSNRFFSVAEMNALMGAGLTVMQCVPAYQDCGEIEPDSFHVLAVARVASAA